MKVFVVVLKFLFSKEREIAPGVFWLGGSLYENRNPPKGEPQLKLKNMKPEFPKPRLIREDFLPEQDQMNNYRTKKITKGDETVWYQPQKKVLWFFWVDISNIGPFSSKHWANEIITEDFQKSQKDKIEYLEYDASLAVSPDPNPPPKVL
jgi:hypothetical protein